VPLIKGKSKPAFEHNFKAEMKAGKPKDQSLAIAYDVKRRSNKKMAEGGEVTAKTESRPMPNKRYNDSRDLFQNDHAKASHEDSWTDTPTERQATASPKPKLQPIRPKIASSGVFKTRHLDAHGNPLDKDELHLEQRDPPASDKQQPPEYDNEKGPNRQGPSVSALKMKKMAEGGPVPHERRLEEYGPASEEDEVEHPAGLESDNDEMAPPESEYMAQHFEDGGEVSSGTTDIHDESNSKKMRGMSKGAESGGPSLSDALDNVKSELFGKAFGGKIGDEEDEEHHASIASAIMARRQKMAEGGQVDIEENAEEQPNEYYHENEDEVLKENYDEGMHSYHSETDDEDGRILPDEDEHENSMISAIRRKMAAKSPISR
jgi:hypothetical protein